MALPNPIDASRMAAGAPVATSLITDLYANEQYLASINISSVDAGGAPLVLNGSFESPAVATSTTPDDWSFVAGTGGSGVTINTDQNHGAQCFKITQDTTAGHSGGTLTSSDFFRVSPSLRYQFRFMLKCNRTDLTNSVVINWYAADQSALSSTTLYATTQTPPTSWTLYGYFVTPPATAMYAKIVITGGANTVTPPAATAYSLWDGISFIVKPALTEQVAYTASTSFVVPSGTVLVRERTYARFSSGNGGYNEKIFSVRPADNIVVVISSTINAVNTVTHSWSGTGTSAYNGGNAAIAGTALGGTANINSFSGAPTTTVILDY